MKKVVAKITISLVSTLLCLGLLEGVTRLMVKPDPDGDLIYHFVRLKPLHPPVAKAKALLDAYNKDIANAKLIYDPELGWRPTAAGSDGNQAGFASSHPNPSQMPRPGRLRIALFGGSYTRGQSDKSWWRVLDEQLRQKGVNAEVFNFGVPGYGMDQAYLRWKKDGAPYRPDLVVFGFSVGNAMDNLNILRLLENPETGIPFTKPRFIMDHDDLKLINSPTVSPDVLLQQIADLSHWPLLQYDHYYNPADYQPRWWEASRLLGLLAAKEELIVERQEADRLYQMDAEPARLALRIVQQFGAEVQRSGSQFLVVHLPAAPELSYYQAHGRFSYSDLYNDMQVSVPVVHTEQNLLQVTGKQDIRSFFDDGHYTDQLHASVGATLAEYIAAHMGKAYPLSRQ